MRRLGRGGLQRWPVLTDLALDQDAGVGQSQDDQAGAVGVGRQDHARLHDDRVLAGLHPADLLGPVGRPRADQVDHPVLEDLRDDQGHADAGADHPGVGEQTQPGADEQPVGLRGVEQVGDEQVDDFGHEYLRVEIYVLDSIQKSGS